MKVSGLLKEAGQVRKDLTLEQMVYARAKTASRLSRVQEDSKKYGLPDNVLERIQASLEDYNQRINLRVVSLAKMAKRDFDSQRS